MAARDLGSLDTDIGQPWSRILQDAFTDGMINDLKMLGSEGTTSHLFWDYSEDKLFIQRTTSDASPGRLIYIQALGSGMTVGQTIQGMQIRARATGTGTIAGGTDGAEIKAGLNSDSDTGTLATARAVIANVDAKKGTITTGTCLEAQVDLGAGGTITTLYGVRASLNNSGTVTNSYAFHVDAVSGYPWKYGLFVKAGMATYPIFIDAHPTGATGINQMEIDIDDTFANSGDARGYYVNWTHTSGTVTGTLTGVGIDMGVTAGTVAAVYPISIYTASMGAGIVANLWCINMYMDDIGGSATVTNKAGMSIGIDNGDGATNCYMLRFYNHGGTINAALHFANNGETAFNHIIHFMAGVKPYVAASSVTTVAGVMQVKVGSTTLYCPLYTTKG